MLNGLTEAVIPGALRAARDSLPSHDFASLVREHQAMVFSIALSCLRDRAVAEEIAQDVFLELHKVLPTLESREHVVHWLRRVTVHRSIDSIRKKRPTLSLMDVREPSVPSAGGDFLLEARLRRLMAELTPKARAAMVLRYQEDLDPSQIAEILEVPVQTVKSRIHRSLALLRKKLERVGRSSHA
jgi:RNA polymerase sigma-70 factor (ECF subfamily)